MKHLRQYIKEIIKEWGGMGHAPSYLNKPPKPKKFWSWPEGSKYWHAQIIDMDGNVHEVPSRHGKERLVMKRTDLRSNDEYNLSKDDFGAFILDGGGYMRTFDSGHREKLVDFLTNKKMKVVK